MPRTIGEELYKTAKAIARRYASPEMSADDLYQEAILKAWGIEGDPPLATTKRAMWNHVKSIMRKLRTRRQATEVRPVQFMQAEDPAFEQMMVDDLMACARVRLHPRTMQVFDRLMAPTPAMGTDIAAALRISEASVSRARSTIRGFVEQVYLGSQRPEVRA